MKESTHTHKKNLQYDLPDQSIPEFINYHTQSLQVEGMEENKVGAYDILGGNNTLELSFSVLVVVLFAFCFFFSFF